MVLLLLTCIFLAIYAGLIFYYYYNWLQLKTFSASSNFSKVFVSVIVAARNEEENIGNLIAALEQQTYPKHLFEVIIVNDYSTDDTANKISPFLSNRIKMIWPHAAAHSSSKKKAIEAGVKAASGTLVVITDADCLPGEKWLETMACFYEEKGPVFIAAPVAFNIEKGVLNAFQVLDFITLQGITAASVHAGTHSMCNGANLAYTKDAFEAVEGFAGIDHIASGDDMLLMYKIWKKWPQKVHYLKCKDAIVKTGAMKSWKAFFNQRIRWASKAGYYEDKKMKLVLAFIYGFNCWFFVLLIATFLKPFYGYYLLLFFLLKTVIELPFVYSVAKFYEAQRLLKKFAIFQPLHMAYTVVVGMVSQWGGYEWKSRRTK